MNCSHLYSQGGYCSKTRSYQSVEVELVSMQKVSKLKSTALQDQELVELGKDLVCSGKEANSLLRNSKRGNARRGRLSKKPGEKKQGRS